MQKKQNKSEQQGTNPKGAAKKVTAFAVGDTPIVVTGGSLRIVYADHAGDNDKFDTDTTPLPDPNPAKAKQKLVHRANPKLLRVDITDDRDATKVYQSVDLEELGINGRCSIRIYYGS